MILVSAIVAFVCAVLWLRRLDGWQRLYVTTIFLLACATSSYSQIAGLAYYPRYAAALALAAWTWRMHANGSQPLKTLPKRIRILIQGLWLAVGLAALSTIWSFDRIGTALQSVALAALAATLHGLATSRWTSPAQIANDMAAPSVLLAVIFSAGLVGDVVGLQGTRAYGGRFQGLFDNPNTLAMTAALVLLILWGLWRSSGKAAYLLFAFPTAASLLLSESRTAAVAVAVAAAWALMRQGPSRAIPKLIIGACVLLTVYLAVAIMNPDSLSVVLGVTDRFAANEGGDLLNTRTDAWQDAVALWGQQPLVGQGYAAGPSLFETLRTSGALAFGRDVVHNSYLQWLMELGILGLIPLTLLVGACVVASVRTVVGPLGRGFASATTAGLLIQMTESSMFGTGQVYPFVFWFAVLGALALKGDVALGIRQETARTRKGVFKGSHTRSPSFGGTSDSASTASAAT